VGVDAAAGHIFGFVLLNDWSARDLQKWAGAYTRPLFSST
jgi:2-keto-4-pentenoate hydratase/2-oxohepta-3-ene-1,7-dioic acid hydratase in catechol pathway